MKEKSEIEELILYHGSKNSIEGSIKPVSRTRCDFGKGFYMGEHKLQAAGNAKNSGSNPMLYTIRVKIPSDFKVIRLEGSDWLYAVLANRRSSRKFNDLDMAREWINKLNKYDLVIGKIADDEMNYAVREFGKNRLTDEGLKWCLSKVGYGDQYAAKTRRMCEQIEIVDVRSINEHNFPEINAYMSKKRADGRDVVDQQFVMSMRRKGFDIRDLGNVMAMVHVSELSEKRIRDDPVAAKKISGKKPWIHLPSETGKRELF